MLSLQNHTIYNPIAEMQRLLRPHGLNAARPQRAHVAMHAGAKGKGYQGDGIPPWKRHQKKGLGRQAEATLETVWSRTQWPSDDTIASMWDLHRVRKDQVIEWFQKRRRAARSKSNNSGSGGSGGAAAEPPGTDWDEEWLTLGPEDAEAADE